MNNLAGTSSRRHCESIPLSITSVIAPLLLAGIAFSLFILVVVHNALLLVALLLLSALVVSFLLWNSLSFRMNLAVFLFVDRLPASDLLTASDGQLVKITGRFAADFYITDAKSGIRALVKAGYDSNVIPLVSENLIVNTTKKNRVLSSTLKKWLEEKSLPVEARLLRLEEGYIEEGASLTVVGMLSKINGILMIVPPSDAISTGCLLQKLLLPVDIYGLVLRFSNRS